MTDMQDTTLEVCDLTKLYGKKLVVNHLNLCLHEGDVWGLVGDNGSGKTTAMQMMVGLTQMNFGSVEIMGYNVFNQYQEAITKVGAVFEHQYYYENFTALQNMRLVSNLCNGVGYTPEEILEIVGLDSANKTKVKKFSTGMRKRLGLAIALISKPRVVLLDEPTNGLDPSGIKALYHLVQHLSKQERVTFLIASHNICDIERICNGVLMIKKGKSILNCHIKELNGKSLEGVYFQLLNSDSVFE